MASRARGWPRRWPGRSSLDPNLKQPYTHETGLFFEQQITEGVGTRVGYVRKTEDDLYGQWQPGRSRDAFTVPFNFVDIGVDGVRGTADDANITLLGLPTSQAANFPVSQVVSNIPDRRSRYNTVEWSFTKRYSNKWSAQGGVSFTKQNDFPSGVTQSINQHPSMPDIQDRTFWSFKLTGSYDAPFGIRISPVLRHQAGSNFARQISIPSSAGNAFGLTIPAITYYADAADDNRQDNIWVFDMRFDRTFNVTNRIRFRGFLDFFNITNSSASETITQTTGANYLRPVNILAPATARLGFRLLW